MEIQSSDPNSGSSSRLEVSIDGLTLSPDPEGDQEHVEGTDSQQLEQESEVQSSPEGNDVEEGETAKAMERKWGFSLEELYGLALKFFKGIISLCPILNLEHLYVKGITLVYVTRFKIVFRFQWPMLLGG